ncbi:MAG: 3-oxoacyl-ACP reductase [Nocardioidaceae bacterium]
MRDPYRFVAQTPVGNRVVKQLGLPNPPRLQRWTPGVPVVDGTVLLGSAEGGRLAGPVAAQLRTLAVPVSQETEAAQRLRALVFDASGVTGPAGLVALQEFCTPRLRSLEPNARVVVLGTPPDACGSTPAAVAQRALEGFTRSLAKEIGHGGTVQLVYVGVGAEQAISSTLAFLLGPKSAYVSGQVVRVGAFGAPAGPAAVDLEQPLTGKVALVTGASRGIGEAIARVLSRDGATVVGVDVPSAAGDLETLMSELTGDAVAVDITTSDAPTRIADRLRHGHGGVDVVVHNAGITRDKKLANMQADGWTATVDVNLGAPLRITESLLEQHLLDADGRIIGVSSIAGIAGNAGQANYATSKAGVIGLVDALSGRLAPRRITVNAVAPGFIETPMTARMPMVIREVGRRMNSMGQGGLPVDVAETIAWFANPSSSAVSGNVVRVCGQSLLGA